MSTKQIVPILFVFFHLYTARLACQYSEVGFGLGTATYWGDLSLPTNYDNMVHNSRLAASVKARWIPNKTIGYAAFLGISQLHGDDAFSTVPQQRLRNLNFTSPLIDVSGLVEFYPFGFCKPMGDLPIYPFLTAGLSAVYFHPYTSYQNQKVYLQPLGTEGQGLPGYPEKYSRISLALPFGGGAKWALNDDWSINLEAIMNRAFTDYLDDVGGMYADYELLKKYNGSVASALSNRGQEYLGSAEPVIYSAGTQRGGTLVKDYYMYLFLSVQMRITDVQGRMMAGRGRSVKCPTFK